MTSASKRARSASLKIAESSVCSLVTPAALNAAVSAGTPCAIASVWRKAAVSEKIRTWASSATRACASVDSGSGVSDQLGSCACAPAGARQPMIISESSSARTDATADFPRSISQFSSQILLCRCEQNRTDLCLSSVRTKAARRGKWGLSAEVSQLLFDRRQKISVRCRAPWRRLGRPPPRHSLSRILQTTSASRGHRRRRVHRRGARTVGEAGRRDHRRRVRFERRAVPRGRRAPGRRARV